MWHWCGEISDQYGESPDYVHGMTKLYVLLPLMFTWGADNAELMQESMYIQSLLMGVNDDESKMVWGAHSLNVSRFSEYLGAKEQYWTKNGIHLTNSDDRYFDAMGFKNRKGLRSVA